MKRSEFEIGMRVTTYDPVVEKSISGVVQNLGEDFVDIKWEDEILACIYLDENLDDINPEIIP